MEKVDRQIRQGVALSSPDALESEVMDTEQRSANDGSLESESEGVGKNRLRAIGSTEITFETKGRKIEMNTNLSGTDGVLEGRLVPSTGALNGNSGNDHHELPQVVSTGNATNGNVATFDLADRGNARRIVHYHGHELRYCQDTGVWLYWLYGFWVEHNGERFIDQIARRIPDHIMDEANTLSNHQDKESYRQWAVLSQDRERIDAMIALAKSEPDLVVQSSQLDSDPYVLNVQNGTLDLLTYELLPHNPADLITRMAFTEYHPEAECPFWERFMDSITLGDVEQIEEIQRLVGRCLTGYPGHKIVYCFGPGGSGKWTFLKTVGYLLGGYTYHAPSGMLDVSHHKCIRSELARLRGARFALSDELKRDKSLDEALMKTLPSTRKKIVARSSGNLLFKFVPTHKLWAYSKHEPILDDTDEHWRDAWFIVFDRVLSRGENRVFRFETFKQEIPGILNWAMQGL